MKEATRQTPTRKLKSSLLKGCLLFLFACSAEEDVGSVTFSAIAGSEGQLIWLNSSDTGVGAALQGYDGSQWLDVSTQGTVREWFVPTSRGLQTFRLLYEDGTTTDALAPMQVQLTFGTSEGQSVFLGTEEAVVQAQIMGTGEYPAQVQASMALVRENQASGVKGPLSPSFVDDVVGVTAAETSLEWQLQGQAERVGREELRLQVIFETETLGDIVLAQESLKLVFLGYDLFWGDLHGHSNLSVDACEDGTKLCADRSEAAGADYFLHAKKNGLDFAAITDHAEYIAYASDGTKDTRVDIWSAQSDHVLAAQDVNFVPILGYEWTYNGDDDDPATGGHRTVLFDSDGLCDDYFIGSGYTGDRSKYFGPGQYYGPNVHINESVFGLQTDLYLASQVCTPARFLMFAHHSAMLIPQHVDWTLAENEPNPDVEMLIEIFSEHGSSELFNPKEEGAFGVDPSKVYAPEGSVQQALMRGYQLGFVGGTDSHDGRPGSLDDGPSCPDYWNADGPICQFHGGALTGALTSELSRDSIFSALSDRRTVVTTGPRGPVRAVMVGSSGAGYPVGTLLPADDAPYQLYLDTTGLQGEVIKREFVSGSEDVMLLTSEVIPITAVALGDSHWGYLRLSIKDADVEHRVWLSPWFWN